MDAGSTFAERFAFSRDHQAIAGLGETDGAFAAGVGVSPAAITDYRQREDAPPSDRVLAIALRCGVDPGWLSFGALTKAPAPSAFEEWLAKQRKNHERKKPSEKAFKKRQASRDIREANGRRRR